MVWIGRSIAAVGVLCILLPVLAVPLNLLGITVPWVSDYAPSFILGGIFLFVIGIAVRTVLGR